jgi:hypothetical protein
MGLGSSAGEICVPLGHAHARERGLQLRAAFDAALQRRGERQLGLRWGGDIDRSALGAEGDRARWHGASTAASTSTRGGGARRQRGAARSRRIAR